jgi:hypothetical protein
VVLEHFQNVYIVRRYKKVGNRWVCGMIHILITNVNKTLTYYKVYTIYIYAVVTRVTHRLQNATFALLNNCRCDEETSSNFKKC